MASAMNTADASSHGAAAGDLKNNSAAFTWDLGGPSRETTATASAANVEIVEPNLQITNTLTTATPVDAGDAVSWDIVIGHSASSDADAYDATFADVIPTTVQFSSFAVTHSTLGDISGLFEFDLGTRTIRTIVGQSFDLLFGQTTTITINATVDVSAQPEEIITNQATVLWTSLDAAVFDGDDANERNGSGGVINNYIASAANSTLSINSPTSAKSLLGTSIVTATNSATQGVIGESAQYRLTLTVPEGTTNISEWTDVLDLGLQFVQLDSVTFSPGLTSSQVTFIPAVTGNGTSSAQTLVFDLGSLTNSNTNNAAAETVVITYTARVANNAGNQGADPPASPTMLQNTATFSWEVSSTPHSIAAVSGTAIEVIEPVLQVTKMADDDTPRLGATLTYTLNINHPIASDTTAQDIRVLDTLPTFVTLNVASISAMGATISSNASAGNVIDLTLSSLPVGSTATVTYTAVVTSNPADIGANINNTARVEWTSLAGTNANERTGTGGAINDYFDTASEAAVIIQPVLQVTKQHTAFVPNGTSPLNWDVTVHVVAMNDGNVDLFDISLLDDLQTQFGAILVGLTAPSTINTTGLTSGGTAPNLNASFDGNLGGSGNTNLFDGASGLLRPGEWIALDFVVTIDPDTVGAAFPITNQVMGDADYTDDSMTQTTTDLSDSGSIPNSSNPGQPGDTGGTNDPTPLYVPDIAVTKAVVGIPTKLPNDNFSVTYNVALKNTGTVNLRDLQITEDLVNEFGALVYVGVITNPSLVSGPSLVGSTAPTLSTPAWDGGVGGSGRVNVFNGTTGLLVPGDSILIQFTVEIDPDASGVAQPENNQVLATGTPLDGTGTPLPTGDVTDLSDSGTDPSTTNPSADGDMGTADDPTPLSIGDIGLAKQVNNVTEILSGIYDVQYAVVLENTGTVAVSNLQVTEDLVAEFGSAFVGIPTTVAISSSSLTAGASLPNLASPAWDANLGGSGNTGFFDGSSGVLNPGDSITLTFTARVNTNFGDTTPPTDYTNQIDASALDPNGLTVNDASDDGTNPNTNNTSGGTNDPSPFIVPMIRAAKLYGGITANADGSYTVPVQIRVENSGTSVLTDLSLIEDITSEFGEAFISVANPQLAAIGAYTGVLPQLNPSWASDTSLDVIRPTQTTETLVAGESYVFSFDVRVDPDRMDGASQLMFNQAVAMGMGLNFDGNTIAVSDDSGAGTSFDAFGVDNDQPSQLLIPEIRVVKSVAALVQSGQDYSVTFAMTVENTGSAPLTGIDLVDDLSTAFGPAFVGIGAVTMNATGVGTGVAPTLNFGATASGTPYDGGAGSTNLLNNNGTLQPGDYFTVSVTFTLDPEAATSNLFLNQANVSGDDPSSNPVTDLSDSGLNPNTSNPGAVNDSGGHDDPTPIEIPDLAVTKRVVGIPTALPNENYSVVYEVNLQNAGTVTLNNLQLTENLEAEFGNLVYVGLRSAPTIVAGPTELGSVAPSLDVTWDGGLAGSANTNLFVVSPASRLMPGDSIIVRFTVEIDPDATGDSSFLTNQVTASGVGLDSTGASLGVVTDISDSGTNPNSTNPTAAGDMGTADDPTPLEIPDIGIAKQINSATPTGVAGEFDVQYVLVVENTGTVVLNNLQLLEDLSSEFGAGFVGIQIVPAITGSSLSVGGVLPSLNGAWNGTTANPTMLNGTSGILHPGDWFSITFTGRMDAVAGDTTVPTDFTNQVIASGDGVTSNGLIPVSDLSDDGANPNTNNGVGGTDDPTGLTSPQMRVGKSYGTVVANSDGTYSVPVAIVVVNTGSSNITQLTLSEDLASEFGDAFIAVTNAQIIAVGSYSGVLPLFNTNWSSSDTSVDVIDPLQTTETLLVGDSFQFTFDVTVDPDAVDGVSQYLLNQAVVTGMSTNFDGSPTTLMDESGWPTPDDLFGNDLDNPADLLIPEIRTTKVVTGVTSVGQNWHVTFEMRVENTGSTDLTGIDLFDNLAAQWGSQFLSIVSASLDATAVGLGTAPTLNFGATAGANPFDGGIASVASANLLNNDGLMNPGEYVTLTVTVALDPDATGASTFLTNQTQATGDGPAATVTDLSDDGVNPNTDNPTAVGDSGTGSHDDPTPLQIGDIGVAKEVVGMPTRMPNGNFQVAYQVLLDNIGTIELRNLQLTEDLVGHFGAGVFVAVTSAPTISAGPSNPASTAPNLTTWDGGIGGNINVFDGLSGRLLPGDSLTVAFSIEVDPNAGSATTYLNQVEATALGSNNLPVTDLSDDGSDPHTANPTAPGDMGTYDDPTPLRLPSIHLAKQVGGGPTLVATGSSNFIVTYQVTMANTGNVTLNGLDLYDDLTAQFGVAFVAITANPVITGHTLGSAANLPTTNVGWQANTSLSMFNDDGSIAPNETITLEYTVEVNSAVVNGTTLLNQAIVIADDPNTGAENGPSDLSDDGPNPEAPNIGSPGDTGGYDDPTPTRLPNSVVGVAKNATFDDTIDVITYDLYLEHLGLVEAHRLSLIENLDAVFGAGNYSVTTPALVSGPTTLTLNSLYNGSTFTQMIGPSSTMLPGETAQIQFVVTVNQIEDVQGNGLSLYRNQVTMVSQNSLGNVYMDVSTDGTDPDLDGDGDPTNNNIPTTGTLTPDATVGVAKLGVATSNSNSVTYVFTFEHFGNTTALNLSAVENLAAVFGSGTYTVVSITRPSGPASFTANGMFDGSADTQLIVAGSTMLPGETASIEVVLDVSSVPAGIYTNSLTVTNEDSDGTPYMDDSQDGVDPDPNANDTPTDDAAPTVVSLHRGVVTGRVHVDFNNNGRQDPGELGIPNVEIVLAGDPMGMQVSYTTTTDVNGDFRFEALWPGDYTLTETQPILFVDGQEVLGNLGGTATDDQFTFSLPALDSVASGYNFNELGLNPLFIGKTLFLASSQGATPPPPLPANEAAYEPYVIASGVLSINGVAGDDHLVLDLASDGFALTRESVRYRFSWNDVSRIAINTALERIS